MAPSARYDQSGLVRRGAAGGVDGYASEASRVFHYRPRILTLIVLIVVASALVLANLSFDSDSLSLGELYSQAWGFKGKFVHKSYGWPLIWHRYVYTSTNARTVGWYYSAPRLAGNLAMWLVQMAAPAAACEWLLRRYRPRLRWSLRTMLVAIGLAAALCGWFVVARDRANLQDSLIATVNGGKGKLFVQRWGPKWLDLVGVGRYRRHITAAALGSGFGLSGFTELRAGDAGDEELLKRMAGLPNLRVLYLAVDRLSPAMADSLREMRHLRKLRVVQSSPIDDDGRSSHACLAATGKLTQLESLHKYDKPVSHACLAVIGKMPQLESLDLSGMTVDGEGLAHLAGLVNLKALRISLDGGPSAENLGERASQEGLAAIGKMSQLEILYLSGKTIDSEGLGCLGGLMNRKSFRLDDSNIWGVGGNVTNLREPG